MHKASPRVFSLYSHSARAIIENGCQFIHVLNYNFRERFYYYCYFFARLPSLSVVIVRLVKLGLLAFLLFPGLNNLFAYLILRPRSDGDLLNSNGIQTTESE